MTYSAKELRANGVEELAIRVRAWRRFHKIRQPRFARMIGCHKGTLGKVETGKLPIGPHLRAKLVWFLIKHDDWRDFAP